MNVIEFNNVWKKFRKGERFDSLRDAIPNLFRKLRTNGTLDDKHFWVLKDVCFDVKKGDVLGIIGPNGAGKSTILKLLSKIMAPNRGNITMNGRVSALIEVGAGFHDDLTGRENIYLNGTILGMTRREIDSKFDDIVEFSGLSEFIDTPVKRYSSGMHSRLGFSVAAHMNPEILLVDEVLAVGDMAFQTKCANKMREMLKSKVTIVIVSHNLSMIQSLCKRVILLNKGEILKEGDPEETIPYYQNIVYKERKDNLKRKSASQGYYLKPNGQAPADITKVILKGYGYEPKEDFKIGEPISITVDFEAREKIENPAFSVDIIRADGVRCCSSNTKSENLSIPVIDGVGTITIDFEEPNLAPGIYLLKISILDRDTLHPYAVRKKDVFRIGISEYKNNSSVVFLPKIKWSFEKEESLIN